MSNDDWLDDEILARILQDEEDEQDRKRQRICEQDERLARSLDQDQNKDDDNVFPDLHDLFMTYNPLYFQDKLGMVEVKWSSRLTLCAGICCYHQGGLCTIKLSEPLLKLRPPQDMIDTLLHEMIHAYLFVTKGHSSHDGHGPEFLEIADRINTMANTNITVYHNFHQEVSYYQQHRWQCNGPCKNQAPYFGLVKRSMNRPPQPADRWFPEHQQTCGGKFIKIAEPAAKIKPNRKPRPSGQKQITDYVKDQEESPMKEAAKKRKW